LAQLRHAVWYTQPCKFGTLLALRLVVVMLLAYQLAHCLANPLQVWRLAS
jgi:hypothetical protein